MNPRENQQDEHFMRMALRVASKGVRKGQAPFGALIVQGERVIVASHNQVLSRTDSTAHAEVLAIRLACRRLDSIDLSRSVIYSTVEPCPMCFSAIHWAKIERIVFGASIADAKGAGFSELEISASSMGELGGSPVGVRGGVLSADCLALLRAYSGPRY